MHPWSSCLYSRKVLRTPSVPPSLKLMETETASPTNESRAGENFLELLQHCRRVLGGHTKLASKRELSDALNVAPGMAGRYIAGETDFYNLRAVTVELLARACGLDVGTVFRWVGQGRQDALAHEALLRREPVAFSALDHVRAAATLLEQQEEAIVQDAREDTPLPTDFDGLTMALAGRRGQDGAAVASLFDTLVHSIGAESCLQRVRAHQELEEDDWFKLQQLLGVPQGELLALFGPGRTPSRT